MIHHQMTMMVETTTMRKRIDQMRKDVKRLKAAEFGTLQLEA